MRCSNHRGSALLIVLGMLSFMIVSAVSFSIYMRQSRTPSTALRRAVSARYLLKAALANAINRLDGNFQPIEGTNKGRIEGICDDAYPGVGPLWKTKEDDENISYNGNYWVKRVFMPFGQAELSETVSTLSLEALAYLPPAIINEVRAYSRLTQTAKWSNLAYDTGRYAFCAVDVSDCYDLNKIRANERRTSAPNRRIGPAYTITANNAALDAAQDKVLKTGLPYTSVADFNLYMGDTSFTPFMGFIGSTDPIYDKNDAPTVSNALFITDTWFPPTNRLNNTEAPKPYDLAAGDQPFKKSAFAKADKLNLLEVEENKTDLGNLLLKSICGTGLVCLFDYLDADSRPISFCMPTVETVPMICALGFVHDNAFSPIVKAGDTRTGTFPVVTGKGVDGKDIVEEYTRVAERYELTRLVEDGDFVVNGSVVFPFKRTGKKGYENKFKVGVLIKIFMGPTVMKTRDAGNGSPLYPGKWPSSKTESFADGVLTICTEEKTLTFDDDIHKQQDAVKDFNIPVTIKTKLAAPAFWYVYCKDKKGAVVTTKIDTADPPYYSMDGIKNNAQALKPYDSDGEVADWWDGLEKVSDDVSSWPNGGSWPDKAKPKEVKLPDHEYVPHVAVWACVKNGDGEVVDLVPAKLLDDREIGERKSLSADDANTLPSMFPFLGVKTPLLSFRGDAGQAFTYSYSDQQDTSAINQRLNGENPTTFGWNCLYAPDPRFNWAPENWLVKTENAGVKGQVWLDDIVKDLLGGERDHDIFLFTSDQELLQSAGELAFLPRLEKLDGKRTLTWEGDYSRYAKCTSCDLNDNRDPEKLDASSFFWQTYTPWDEDVYNLPLSAGAEPTEITSGQNDWRLNPFSQDPRLFSALVLGTPFDYAVASTNADEDIRVVPKKFDKEPGNALEYCFAPDDGKSSPPASAQLAEEDLADLAHKLQTHFTEAAREGETDWRIIYNDLAWDEGIGDDRKSLFGVSDLNVPLHSVDRKFLYSFWGECLQNKQQLFLVFIRAEPLTVGGMGQGSLAAAQMGARGVALVWRNPMPSVYNRGQRLKPNERKETTVNRWREAMTESGPHRTRVLFYRQLD